MSNKIAGIFFPAFAMLGVIAMTLTGAFGDDEANKSFFFLSLVVVFPLAFLVQGISCALNKINPWIALAVSYIAFVIILFTVLNSSAWDYGIYFLVFWLVGYFATKGIQKLRAKNNK
ncbi:hypothetical protein JFL43_03930 [Viridibacillus sp. YIM B01967]|uniref:DUF2651 domain-containing protein n=1 Tax=Viridibacillus soli TaxID=2798301 RepID=A0ABS1H3P0_9BACL|nr:hypothetical protein [Viridibacillus soli]MBK3494021.1 hypothetical protein [Viridibacillus soli]